MLRKDGSMACFLVPTTAAIVTAGIKHGMKAEASAESHPGRISMRTKLSWLVTMMAGGAILLALEHIWHGEVIFAYPFLTAMSNQADTVAMVQEMSTVGVGMAAIILVAWGVMVLVAERVPAVRRLVVGK
jgi:hypothetical protein